MQTRLYIYVLVMCCSGLLRAQSNNDSVFNGKIIHAIALKNAATNTSFNLSSSRDSKLLLFVFLSPECPLCKNYTTVINDLQKRYAEQVEVWGIIPGKSYSVNDIEKFAKKYKTVFPLLIDPQKKLSNYLQAKITPEAILLDNEYELIYRGAIDDQVKSLSERSIKANRLYLIDAISAGLGHQALTLKRTKAVGCVINDY